MDLAALNFVPIPIVVLDRDGQDVFRYAWMNRACTSFSGLGMDEVQGKTPDEVFPGRAGDMLAQRQASVAASGKAAQYEYALRLPKGEVWIETMLTPVCDDAGKVVRLIATMQDKTVERQLAFERADTDAALKEMECDIENYISMAAHDLKTPMRHVRELAALLREGFVDHGDGKLELIDMLEEVGVKASALISEVLAFARASTTPEQTGRVELTQLAMDIFTILDPQEVHLLSADEVTIETDTTALQIVLRNLVDNALKHGGRACVSLHIALEADADGHLNFGLLDNGRGFDDPAMVFLDTGEFRYETGFGMLGVKRMLHARGGTIAAENLGGDKGAMVRFSLPGRKIMDQFDTVPLAGEPDTRAAF